MPLSTFVAHNFAVDSLPLVQFAPRRPGREGEDVCLGQVALTRRFAVSTSMEHCRLLNPQDPESLEFYCHVDVRADLREGHPHAVLQSYFVDLTDAVVDFTPEDAMRDLRRARSDLYHGALPANSLLGNFQAASIEHNIYHTNSNPDGAQPMSAWIAIENQDHGFYTDVFGKMLGLRKNYEGSFTATLRQFAARHGCQVFYSLQRADKMYPDLTCRDGTVLERVGRCARAPAGGATRP